MPKATKASKPTGLSFEQKYKFAQEKLKDFKGYLELGDFRRFLLLMLNLETGGPESILSQLGMGGKGKTTIPYDPEKKAYYAKIMSGLSMNDQLMIYIKENEHFCKLLNKPESPLFEKYLTPFERKNLLPAKFALISPQVVDYTKSAYTKESSPKPSFSAVESLFVDLMEMIVSQSMKYVFVIEGKDDEPDLIFMINMSFDPTHSSPNQIQYFDVYVDEAKQLRGKLFIKTTEDLQISFLEEIKGDISEMYNSNFTIIVPIKSFNAL